MKLNRMPRLLALMALLVSTLAAPAAAQTPSNDRAAIEQALLSDLNQATASHVQVARHRGTGLVRFVGTSADFAVARPNNLPADAAPARVAQTFLATYGPLFGIDNAERDLSVVQQTLRADGRSVVRFQHRVAGLPVFAGEFVVSLTRDNRLLAISGETAGFTGATTPQLAAADAQATALGYVARHAHVTATTLTAQAPTLAIFNPALVRPNALNASHLVWQIEVAGSEATGEPLRQVVLIDALGGQVVEAISRVAYAKNRTVCDSENVVDPDGNENTDCDQASEHVREEGDPPTGNAEVDLAYDYSGATYDFYQTNFGRDSIDDNGMPLISVVNYCPDAGNCPYANAFWNGSQMTYGAGFAAADDVVAHELTHGVTENTSGLLYYYQAGAMNEALSDIFGEYVDLTDGLGTDTPAVRWQLGEDLIPNGIRNMQNPTLFADPDRMLSPLYLLDDNQRDHGGVHTNSGVANKTAYLITDGTAAEPGGSFNGQTFTGLGVAKAVQIWYEAATTSLTSGSDYADLADGLRQACTTLTGQHGIVAADCANVGKALLATEMDLSPTNAPAADVEVCRTGQTVNTLFADSFEGAVQWTKTTIAGSNAWTLPETGYAVDGIKMLYNNGTSGIQDAAIAMNTGVLIPANAYLRFSQAYDFEADANDANDGGLLEFSDDNGTTWQDASPLFTFNGYNGTLSSASNPNMGRAAFTGISHGYLSTRVDLTSLVNKTVRFRFRASYDNAFSKEELGWAIDDLRIYTCSGSGPRTAPLAQATGIIATRQGDPAISGVVGLVSDAEQTAGSLSLSLLDAPAGMTVNLVNENGIVTAEVLCSCAVEPGTYEITAEVANADALTDTLMFVVEVDQAGQVVVNGGFEQGSLGWTLSTTTWGGSNVPFCDTVSCFGVPYAGAGWLRLGGRNNLVDTTSVTQDFTVAADSPATISFQLNMFQRSSLGDADYMQVLIDSTAVYTVTASTDVFEANYAPVQFNVATLAAGQHTLTLRSHTEASGSPTRFSVDALKLVLTENGCSRSEFKLFMPLVRK